MLRATALVFVLTLATSVPATAAERPASPTPLADAVTAAAHAAVAPTVPAWAVDQPQGRPGALMTMYATYAALQVMDVYSTRKALAAGATEANPLMTGGSAPQIAVKAATGAATIYFAERAWKKNRVGAIVLMAALNGTTAAIVARNAQHARR